MVDRVKGGTPIAKKVVAQMKRQAGGRVVNRKEVISGRAMAEELQRTVISPPRPAGLHPALN